ncbi:proline--tRNA ligase [Fimbriimonadia bacterium ATM]|nr:MAG: proline--tRNA ligase [Armatimonadota bacterium]MBC6968818.1 proline--tRNA ligase [Armatimonadota bacterium]MCE7899947.1 proline--tRNA ligase [Armatimonadetes bacterium ATM1]MDL1929260.1 proline--tRNA ligase [Fimbriimonadia bacterium ATM]RIJ96881.1 MAG: proline--tRNA ligase [Armatimonadota bacterium]
MANLGITPRSQGFSDWYNDLVVKADLADYSAVKGCMVIKPHGYAIWELMQRALDDMFKASGHSNAYFPLFVPKSFLSKEAEHVEGFAKECAVVTHHRLMNNPDGPGVVVDPTAKLEEELVIRPTSETIIWNSFKNWIQSYRDLPLLINQWANVVRWEMRTRLFLRTAEFLWQEGHTAHATFEDAEAEALTILDIYRRFAEEWMAVPVLTGVKSENEKFAGADHTYCIEALVQDLRCVQAGTSHHLGQNFAKAFDVKFQTDKGALEYVHATSWGVSTRLVGTLVMAHSDDKGLVLPPRMAPVQCVIVPIWGGKAELREKVVAASERLAERLRATKWSDSPLRVRVDAREHESPGYKFNDWELRGACVRLELGPRDLEANQTVLSQRTGGEKAPVSVDNVCDEVCRRLDDLQRLLYRSALDFREANTKRVDTWEEFKAIFEPEGGAGFVVAHWDGTVETEKAIAEQTKATIRCITLDPLDPEDDKPGKCVYSGKPSSRRVVFAKAY